MIPRISYFGAAVANLLSALVLMLVYFHYANKIINIRINWLTIGKLILVVSATALTTIIARSLPVNFVIQIVGIAILYFALLSAFKIISINEMGSLLFSRSPNNS